MLTTPEDYALARAFFASDQIGARTKNCLANLLGTKLDGVHPCGYSPEFRERVLPRIHWGMLCSVTDQELSRIPNFGRKSFNEFRSLVPFDPRDGSVNRPWAKGIIASVARASAAMELS